MTFMCQEQTALQVSRGMESTEEGPNDYGPPERTTVMNDYPSDHIDVRPRGARGNAARLCKSTAR